MRNPIPSRKLVTAFVMLGLTLAIPHRVGAQTDDFNDGNDTLPTPAWVHQDPIKQATGGAFGDFATWNFPSGGYRITAAPSPDAGTVGPGRAASVYPVAMGSFYVAVDLVDWDDTSNQAYGILTRLTAIGPGSTLGYAFTYQGSTHDVQISKVTGEVATAVTSKDIVLDTLKDYRIVFMGNGANLEGRVYELPDITHPIVVASGMDATYTSGQVGLFVYDNGGGLGATATFDNFFLSDHDPMMVVDDFNDSNDTLPAPAWVHLDPIAAVFSPPVYTGATFTFPGGGYQLMSPVPGFPDAGGPRVESLREEALWSDFYVAADVLNWDDLHHTLFGVIARAITPGLGTTAGYVFSWENGNGPYPNSTDGDLDVLWIEAEGGSAGQMEHNVPNQDSGLHLTNGNSYRFVFIGAGTNFEARIYQLPDTANPIKRLLAVDTAIDGPLFTNGYVGLIVVDHPAASGDFPAVATFDNFVANIAEPGLTVTPNAGAVDVSWPVLAGLWVLQSTPSLETPVVWSDIGTGVSNTGSINTYSTAAPTGSQYFRLISR